MAKQLLGKEVTAALNERIKGNVAKLKEKGIQPTLGIIRVGEREDDLSYERGATKRCETLGVAYEKILLPADVSQEELMAAVDRVNNDDNIHGVLIFRPLPKHLDEAAVIKALSPEKDVDGITDGSMVGVFAGTDQGFPPCTPGHVWRFWIITESTVPEEGCRDRTLSGCGKTGGYDASEKERDGYYLPHENEGYAVCGERG